MVGLRWKVFCHPNNIARHFINASLNLDYLNRRPGFIPLRTADIALYYDFMNKDPQIRRRTGMTLAGCVAASLLLAGCATESTSDNDRGTSAAPVTTTTHVKQRPQCHFPKVGSADIDTWGKVPEELNESVLAKHMNVTPEAINNGLMGTVNCDPGFPIEDMGTPDDILHIDNLPQNWELQNKCTVVFVDVAPKAGAISMNPTVLCAAAAGQPA